MPNKSVLRAVEKAIPMPGTIIKLLMTTGDDLYLLIVDLQTEVSLYCDNISKLAQIHTIYTLLLLFRHFLLILKLEKSSQQACVYLCQFANVSQHYNETSIRSLYIVVLNKN